MYAFQYFIKFVESNEIILIKRIHQKLIHTNSASKSKSKGTPKMENGDESDKFPTRILWITCKDYLNHPLNNKDNL